MLVGCSTHLPADGVASAANPPSSAHESSCHHFKPGAANRAASSFPPLRWPCTPVQPSGCVDQQRKSSVAPLDLPGRSRAPVLSIDFDQTIQRRSDDLDCRGRSSWLDYRNGCSALQNPRTSGMARNPAYFRGGSRKVVFSGFHKHFSKIRNSGRPEQVARSRSTPIQGWGFAETGVELFEK